MRDSLYELGCRSFTSSTTKAGTRHVDLAGQPRPAHRPALTVHFFVYLDPGDHFLASQRSSNPDGGIETGAARFRGTVPSFFTTSTGICSPRPKHRRACLGLLPASRSKAASEKESTPSAAQSPFLATGASRASRCQLSCHSSS